MTINNGEQVIDLAKALGEMARVADMVCVVRCRDCKYWAGENGERITIPAHENCYFFRADDYCSYGERKDGDPE